MFARRRNITGPSASRDAGRSLSLKLLSRSCLEHYAVPWLIGISLLCVRPAQCYSFLDFSRELGATIACLRVFSAASLLVLAFAWNRLSTRANNAMSLYLLWNLVFAGIVSSCVRVNEDAFAEYPLLFNLCREKRY